MRSNAIEQRLTPPLAAPMDKSWAAKTFFRNYVFYDPRQMGPNHNEAQHWHENWKKGGATEEDVLELARAYVDSGQLQQDYWAKFGWAGSKDFNPAQHMDYIVRQMTKDKARLLDEAKRGPVSVVAGKQAPGQPDQPSPAPIPQSAAGPLGMIMLKRSLQQGGLK